MAFVPTNSELRLAALLLGSLLVCSVFLRFRLTTNQMTTAHERIKTSAPHTVPAINAILELLLDSAADEPTITADSGIFGPPVTVADVVFTEGDASDENVL